MSDVHSKETRSYNMSRIRGKDTHIVKNPEIAIGVEGRIVERKVTDTDAEVACTGGRNRKGIGDKTSEVFTDFHTNASDVDFRLNPSSAVGGVINIAVIVVFTVPLVETNINNISFGGIDIVDADKSIEVARLAGALVEHAHHHETILG